MEITENSEVIVEVPVAEVLEALEALTFSTNVAISLGQVLEAVQGGLDLEVGSGRSYIKGGKRQTLILRARTAKGVR